MTASLQIIKAPTVALLAGLLLGILLPRGHNKTQRSSGKTLNEV